MSKQPEQFDNRPIGVFDSGIGGLTVVKQLMSLLPGESILYFGDTARIPYGTKSEETVLRFALEDSFFLLEKDVKLIVVACNTASSVAVSFLQQHLPVSVLGVIEPGARAAASVSRNGKIGVIGTASTIRSGAYHRFLKQQNSNLQIVSQPCPLFVPLVEEGWIEDDVTYQIARRYLMPLIANKVDTLILGCTHYPLLKNVLQQVMGEDVRLVDSAVETAHQASVLLSSLHLNAAPDNLPTHRFFLSDLPYKFQEVGERFLERSMPHVETVNFEDFILSRGLDFWEDFKDKIKKYLLTSRYKQE